MVAHVDAAPAIIFGVLYFAIFLVLTVLYAQKKINWKSRYSFVYFHCITRIGGQACAIGFAVMSWDPFLPRLQVLIASLILGAEGYFTLVLCAYRFLVVWENDRFGVSFLEPKVPKGTPLLERLRILQRTYMTFVHTVLIGANTMIIIGGSMLSKAIADEAEGKPANVSTGKSLRVAGVALFLALVQLFLAFAVRSYRLKGDRTLLLIMLTWPFLSVRGVYGILSVLLKAYSFYNPEVYNEDGMGPTYLVGEWVLGAAMEWMACALLVATYFSRVNGGEVVREEWEEKKEQGEQVAAV